jgi:SP family myo-inositol transporter-like MFS transporter 13
MIQIKIKKDFAEKEKKGNYFEAVLSWWNQGRKEEAESILRKIYPANEVEQEIDAMRQSVEEEVQLEGSIGEQGLIGKLRKALGSKVVRRGLMAGVIVQVAQQFVGINTVMYYSPTIVQLAGFASNNTAMALSLITSGLNAIGSVVSMFFVDRAGRRRLMLISLVGIVVWLAVLGGTFLGAAHHAPPVSELETQLLANQTQTCPDFNQNVRWSCMNCLKAPSTCGFCAHQGDKASLSLQHFF